MRLIGFSTGALALGDTIQALRMLQDAPVNAVELSALREHELTPLVRLSKTLELQRFAYIAVHAPARFERKQEPGIVEQLATFANRGWPIVLHPDAIYDYGCWRSLGRSLLIENMDKRKLVGRTVNELRSIFEKLPSAGLCFDIAHARQFDSSMTEAYLILSTFGDLIRQVHISEVPSSSRHDRISPIAAAAYGNVGRLIPPQAPIILETPVRKHEMAAELAVVLSALCVGGSERASSTATY